MERESSGQLEAAVLTVGDELVTGYRLDTNSQFISQRLSALALGVVLHVSVGDEIAAIHRGLSAVFDVADVVVVTGGLGPTVDDLTREALAGYFDLALVEDTEALERIRERFDRAGRAMPERNRVQALVPAGSQVIQNDRGTAPGFYLQQGGRHVFVTPGIPDEMEGMLASFVLPRLRELAAGGQVMQSAVLKVYGLPESEVNRRLGGMMERGRNPLLGLLPHRGTITVEVVARGAAPAQVQALVAADVARIHERLDPYVISEDERELPQVLADLLLARGLTIATAEVGTGGLVTARLTEPAGSARWFRLGLVPGAETAGDAATLAKKVRLTADADVGVGIGPVVVPPDSTPARPYGRVEAAVSLSGRVIERELRLNGNPARVREWAADGVLALVRAAIIEQHER